MRAAAYLPALLLLAGCAAQPAPTGAPTPNAARQVEQAARLAQQGDRKEADRILRGIIGSPSFETLDSRHQHQALLVDGKLAAQLHDWERAHTLTKRASEMREADASDWYQRLRTATWKYDHRDAAAALVELAKRWPQMLIQFETQEAEESANLELALWELLDSGSKADRYTVLRALQDGQFAEEPGRASFWWEELALLQLERGENDAAVATLSRVTKPFIVISIEVDKRFDPIRPELSANLDVAKTTERVIAAALTEAQTNPRSLKSMVRLIGILRHSGRFKEALQVADFAIERQEAEGQAAYDDYERYYVWVLNDRAYALYSLGRWDAAALQMESASRMSEDGDPNVSQLFNLALMYSDLGRPEETLAALKKAGPASPYGNTVAQDARLKAAVQLKDTKAVNEALQFLSEHRQDSMSNYQEALLYADREEEGAKLLISRLVDPRLRGGALLAIQQYAEETLPPQVVLAKRRWQALIARPDVQDAIRAVGYVRRYPLMYDDY